MTKANITQYSSTPSSNADINDINIAENCPASGLNNAIRELMAHLKNVDTGSQALTALSVAGSVTATTSLKTPLIEFTDGDNALTIADGGNVTANADLTVSGAFTSQGIDDNADANAITIDSSENVGIGTSSPATKLDVLGNNLLATFSGTDTASTYLSFKYNTSTLSAFIGNGSSVLSGANNSDFIIRSQGDLVFASNGNNRRATIDSSGNVSVGTTTAVAKFTAVGSNFGISSETTAGGNAGVAIASKRTSNGIQMRFYQGSTVCGDITTNGSAVSYGSNSDYRLKENVVTNWDATTRLKQLNPVRFNFIADADTTVDGFLAHEVSSIVPEAITGTHNEVDDDGNPVMQGIDQSKLVPLLVKTIQELEARITALENA